MKLDVWVTVGKPSESIFLETRSVSVDLPTDVDPRTVVFELPPGARLDGRGPIRVILEPRPSAAAVELPRKGALRGPDLLAALHEKGLIPATVRRVIIDCPHDGFATIHIQGGLDNEKATKLLPALLLGATVLEAAPATSEPANLDDLPF